MSADLYIHSAEKLTDDDFRCFFSTMFGSKWFNPNASCDAFAPGDCPHWKRVMGSDSVWIGEVSWLKQAFIGEGYVPEPVHTIAAIIGEDLPVLDDQLHERIMEALSRPNESAPQYSVSNPSTVEEWLTSHRGHRLFTVSW